jgi:hypothetical protein
MLTVRSKRLACAITIGRILPLATGCADLTSGGADGRAQAYMSGDAATSAPASRSGAALRDARASAAVDADLTVAAQVFLTGGPEGEVQLTSGAQTMTLPAQGATAVKVGDASVAAGIYTGVRVVFSRVEANVRSGVLVGGVPVVGLVKVSASPQNPVVVERALQVEVDEGATAAVQIDLHAPVWLAAAVPPSNTVASSAFTAAVQIARR